MKTIVKMLKTQNMTIHMEYIQQNKHATKHGDFTGYYPGGKRAITGSYIYGKPNGKWSRWYENGQMASVHHYMLGMLHGDYIQFFESGDQARKGKYLKGKPEGEHLIYFKKNRIEKRFIYKRGKIRRAEFLIKTRLSILDYVEGVLLLNGDEYKYKKVCLLTDTGELICKTPAQIIEDLSTMVDPDFIHDILDYFDRLFEDLALNNDKEILVGCAGGVLAVPTDQSGAPTVPQIDNPNLNRAPMTQTEIDSIFTACRDASRGAMGLDSSVPNFNNQRDNFVQDTVAGITAQVSNCRESSNDSIASGPGLIGRCMANPLCTEIFGGIIAGGVVSGGENIAVKKAVDDGFAPPVDPDADPTVSVYKADNRIVRLEYNDGTVITTQPTTSGDPGISKTTIKSPDKSKLIIYYDKDKNPIWMEEYGSEGNLVDSGRPPEPPPPPPPPPTDEKELPDGDMDILPDGDMDINPAPAPKPAPPPPAPPGIPDASQPIDESGIGRCESLAMWWAEKQAYCDDVNWQTYECEQILRVANGCVDLALINPAPDGTSTCAQKKSMTPEETRAENCRRRSGIMLPSGFDSELCGPIDTVGMPEREICNDPRAMCNPEQLLSDQTLTIDDMSLDQSFAFAPSTANGKNLQVLPREAGESYRFLSDDDFDEYVVNAKSPLVVVFGSKNCPPCKRVLSQLDDLQNDLSTKVEACYVEVPQNPRLAHDFDVKYTPTIVVFEKGKTKGQRRVGAATREMLLRYVKRSLSIKDINIVDENHLAN